MTCLRRFNERHQITIPPGLLRDAGLPESGLYSIEAKAGRIILEPKEIGDTELGQEDWEALEALVRRQIKAKEFTEYATGRNAKSHFKRLRK